MIKSILTTIVRVWYMTVLFTQLTLCSEAATNELVVPDNVHCACPGDVLTFTCTIVGGGNTIWRGSAFDCPSTSNEIILRHSTFGSTGTSGTCNSGTIVGQSFGVQDNCFTSRLYVTVSESLYSGDVQCDHNSNTGTRNVGTVVLNVISAANPYQLPNNINLIEISQGQVTFNWSSDSNSSCPSIDYVITSDCGVCPSSANSTTVTCFDLHPPNQSGSIECSFNVTSRVCDITGYDSTSVMLALSVPDVPSVRIIPYYSNTSQELLQLLIMVSMNKTAVISDDISAAITSYYVSYLQRNNVIATTNIPALPCEDDACHFNVDIPSSVCLSSKDVSITVSKINRIGQGPPSNVVTAGCSNEFVRVKYDPATSVFQCVFLSHLDSSEKMCSLSYGVCNGNLMVSVERNSTIDNSNSVYLDLANLMCDATICYLITASNSTSRVKLEGTFRTGSRKSHMNSTGNQLLITAIVCSLVCFVFGAFVGAFIASLACLKYVQKVKKTYVLTSSGPAPPTASVPVIYEEVLPDSHTGRKNDIELSENVAYGPVTK